jgi:hypothetical protein
VSNGVAGNATLTAAATGNYYLWLGGTLTPPASGTAAGTYTGTWNLTVAY